jgi:hypothetical protein
MITCPHPSTLDREWGTTCQDCGRLVGEDPPLLAGDPVLREIFAPLYAKADELRRKTEALFDDHERRAIDFWRQHTFDPPPQLDSQA